MITKLTKKNIEAMEFYKNKWLDIGLRPKKFTLEEATPIVNGVYDLIGKKHPELILIMDNPRDAWIATCMMATDLSRIESQVESRVRSQMMSLVWSRVESQVRSQVGSQIRSQIRPQVTSQVWSQVGSQVMSQVMSQVESQIELQVGSFTCPYVDGSMMVSYFSSYDYVFNELKIHNTIPDLWEKYLATHKINLCYPLDNVCILSQHFDYVKMKNKRLHSDGSPAIHYNGFDVYALNGVSVPEWLVMQKWNEIDCKKILAEQNAEVRREIVRKVGIERVCSELDAKCIDRVGDYELLILDLGDNRKRPYLKMLNPSIGTYHIEGVHPDCLTVEAALNFRNGTVEKPLILT